MQSRLSIKILKIIVKIDCYALYELALSIAQIQFNSIQMKILNMIPFKLLYQQSNDLLVNVPLDISKALAKSTKMMAKLFVLTSIMVLF